MFVCLKYIVCVSQFDEQLQPFFWIFQIIRKLNQLRMKRMRLFIAKSSVVAVFARLCDNSQTQTCRMPLVCPSLWVFVHLTEIYWPKYLIFATLQSLFSVIFPFFGSSCVIVFLSQIFQIVQKFNLTICFAWNEIQNT